MPFACVMWNCKCASDARMLGYWRCHRSVFCSVIWSWFIWLVSFNQTDETDRIDQMDETDFFCGLQERIVACFDPVIFFESSSGFARES